MGAKSSGGMIGRACSVNESVLSAFSRCVQRTRMDVGSSGVALHGVLNRLETPDDKARMVRMDLIGFWCGAECDTSLGASSIDSQILISIPRE